MYAPIVGEVIATAGFVVSITNEVDPEELVLKLSQCMKDNKGIGISAPQCGIRANVFLMNCDPDVIACFNARIVDQSKEIESAMEGCLSYPTLVVKVPRFKVIKVRFANAEGQVITHKFQDFSARVFQHELDHMLGKNYINAANFLNKEIALRRFKKILRQRKKTLI